MKAERDILAEADNEWVVRLYYSFQDRDSLYFVMDYIPGGDMMSLLIRMGVFPELLARFYVAELTLAIESVHKMGFIHRDIKPDNILIDLDGHIKLTDFGLCTGFRWTHNSKYYQKGETLLSEYTVHTCSLNYEDTVCGFSVLMFVTCTNTDMHTIFVGLLYNSCLVISNRESSGFDCVFSNIVFREN